MDRFIEQTPFFTPEHRNLAASIAGFVESEVEPRAADERDVDARTAEYLKLLALAGVLGYAVATPNTRFDVRALCLIREALAYSSSLADLAFVMQGLGTYALSQGAPERILNFWRARASDGRAIAAFALTEPEAGSGAAAIQTTARRD